MGSESYFDWRESMEKGQRESERQVQSLLCKTKRLKEENDELRAQVSSSSPLTTDNLSASEQHPDRMTRHLFLGT